MAQSGSARQGSGGIGIGGRPKVDHVRHAIYFTGDGVEAARWFSLFDSGFDSVLDSLFDSLESLFDSLESLFDPDSDSDSGFAFEPLVEDGLLPPRA